MVLGYHLLIHVLLELLPVIHRIPNGQRRREHVTSAVVYREMVHAVVR